MTEPSATIAPAPVDNASPAEDLIDIFFAPAKVFARRAKANPMFPYLVLSAVMIMIFFASKNALAPIFDAQIQKSLALQMKTNPQFTPAMAEKAKPFIAITINVAGVVFVPITLLLLGLITWIVGRFVMSSELTFGTALLIVSYSWFPRIIGGAIGLVEGLTMDVSRMTSPYQLSISVARLFDPSTMSDGAYRCLGQLDVFAIWGVALLVIGLIHAGKLDKNKAIATGVIVFVASATPAIWAVINGT